ncbi:T9SS type B sorting domain-containing protein, partial [Lacinutrix cladophorae]
LDATGEAVINIPGVTTDQTISLTQVTNPTTSCSGVLTSSETVNVFANPSILSLASNSVVCEGDEAIFTITGTLGDEVFYNINGGPLQQALIGNSGTVNISIVGVVNNQTIVLDSVMNSSTTCSSLLVNTETVSVIPLVNASFEMNPNCNGATPIINGTTGGVFAFNINPGDGAVIDSVSGEVTNAVSNATYSIIYTVNGMCNSDFKIESFTVFPYPNVHLEDEFILCLDAEGNIINQPIIDTGLSLSDYSFEWIKMSNPSIVLGTNSYYQPEVAGTYSVLVTNNNTTCSTLLGDFNTIATVTKSIAPSGLNVIITSETFEDNNIIEVSVNEELGIIYEFSLDGGIFQNNGTNSLTFYNVTSGTHLITARDVSGCDEVSETVFIIDYPLFFTPNNDGYNDTWQITGLNNQLEATVYIYDRYGKLLRQINANSTGWDGTLKGQPLPSSDYWFTLEYRDPNNILDSTKRVYKSHFTLKR